VAILLDINRSELRDRALHAQSVFLRLLAADDSPATEDSRKDAIELIRRAVNELSEDISREMNRAQASTGVIALEGLDQLQSGAIELATSELDIAYLALRRRRPPLVDSLRAPRYAAPRSHWERSQQSAEATSPDIPNAFREGVNALESLARIIVPGTATLGDSVKSLRSNKIVDPGIDKILEGIWTFSSAAPGLRHGSPEMPSLSEPDWHRFRLLLEAALGFLIDADAQ
jgi:hypothetical protein